MKFKNQPLSKLLDNMLNTTENLFYGQPYICEPYNVKPLRLSGGEYEGEYALFLMLFCQDNKIDCPIFADAHMVERNNIKINNGEENNKIHYSEEDTYFYHISQLDKNNELVKKAFSRFLKSTSQNEICQKAIYNIINYNLLSTFIEFNKEGLSYYDIKEDLISLPFADYFKNSQDFVANFFHELAHATGKNYDRFSIEKGWGVDNNFYIKEELIAELTALILSSEFGLTKTIKEDTIPYLKSWREIIKDKKILKSVLLEVSYAQGFISMILQKEIKEVELTAETK